MPSTVYLVSDCPVQCSTCLVVFSASSGLYEGVDPSFGRRRSLSYDPNKAMTVRIARGVGHTGRRLACDRGIRHRIRITVGAIIVSPTLAYWRFRSCRE